ncbi:MAG: hypothetical protein QXQ18_02495 [Candidatus Aenigmatarchaeota archaeon]
MAYSYTNSKGQTYWLHTKGGKLFYFSKDPEGAIDLPEGFVVVENPKTGLPMIRKK